MKFLSFFRHSKVIVLTLFCIVTVCGVFPGCYSFTGASVPPHLKTLEIATAEDKSGFGVAVFRQDLTELLLDKFRRDNSFELVRERPDARLASTIVSITEDVALVTSGELEDKRKVTVRVQVVYDDLVKHRQIWSKTPEQFEVYNVSEGLEGRNIAVRLALERIADDILLAVVSGW